jgi:hypothetical protein
MFCNLSGGALLIDIVSLTLTAIKMRAARCSKGVATNRRWSKYWRRMEGGTFRWRSGW